MSKKIVVMSCAGMSPSELGDIAEQLNSHPKLRDDYQFLLSNKIVNLLDRDELLEIIEEVKDNE